MPSRAAWRWRCFRNSACRATRSATCCISPRCWTRWRPRSRIWSRRRPICCRCCWSARRCAMPERCTTARWRSIAAGCSAWCRRCICPTTANSTSRGISWRATGWWAARSPSAALTAPFGTDLLFAAEDVPGLDRARRDLRGHLDPRAAQFAGRTGRRDGARQPVRQQHHDRQGRDAAAAVRLAIGALRGRLSVRRGRRGRVHHRSRLGRPGLDLRERRDAGRDRALSRRPASSPMADIDLDLLRHERMQMGSFDTNRRRHPAAFRRIGFRLDPPAGDIGLRAQDRALSVRAGRSRRGSNRIATRPTTSRSRAWRSGCARPASSAW